MPEIDEYDAYNDSLDAENDYYVFLAGLNHQDTNAPPEPRRASQVAEKIPACESASPPRSPTSAYSDEYSAYNFSEFTSEDLAAIDASAFVAHVSSSAFKAPPVSSPGKRTNAIASTSTRPNARTGNVFGGPAIEIQVEQYANFSAIIKASKGPESRGSSSTAGTKDNGATVSREGLNGYRPQLSPFEQFRSWSGTLAVTDLTGPSWCEVQFDYGLRQGRSRKLADRPSSFLTAEGNVISVDSGVAAINDRIVTKGKTVHKALEREVHPEEIQIEIETNQDRWGARLVNMIMSIDSIIHQGRCREMPVFGVLHDELIVGIIDSIELQMMPPPASPAPAAPAVENENGKLKRGRNHLSVPNTPTKAKTKKTCRSPSPTQSSIDSFFRPKGVDETVEGGGWTHDQLIPGAPQDTQLYYPRRWLHISDTKTRSQPSLPQEQDTLPARLQLMLYHKLLSNLLADPSSPNAVDFDAVWARLRISPIVSFSDKFVDQAGLDQFGEPGEVRCLADLVDVFRHIVEALAVEGVDPALTVEYRSRSKRRRKHSTEPEKGANADVLNVDSEAEVEQVLVASLESSPASYHQNGQTDTLASVHVSGPDEKRALPRRGGSTDASGALADASSSHLVNGDTDETSDDEQLQWAIHQSLIKTDPGLKAEAAVGVEGHRPRQDTAEDTGTDTSDADADKDKDKPCPKRWDIIGTKTVYYDDDFIESYLTDVLQYWHGERAPRGVEISLTRRCLWCEYREGCEWRAQKAEEAAISMMRQIQ